MEDEKFDYERKRNNFKTLALSKVVYLALMTVVPNHFTFELIKIYTNFIWKNTSPNIKRKTLTLEYKHGGLKCADVIFMIRSL